MDIPPALPRRGGSVMAALGRATLALFGFRIEGTLPNRPKLVVIVAPHTSNWDFVVGLAARYAIGVDISWLGKHTLFRWPLGTLFRLWGGIPVDRRASHDVVAQVVARFRESDQMVVGIAPEGTRKSVESWKTGFWYIAHSAGTAIVPVALDWGRKVVRIGEAVETTGDVEADVRALQAGYADVRGKR